VKAIAGPASASMAIAEARKVFRTLASDDLTWTVVGEATDCQINFQVGGKLNAKEQPDPNGYRVG
jgi:hypothetical protein